MFSCRGAFLLLIFFSSSTMAQTSPSGDLAKKVVPPSILGPRTLVVPDPFDGNKALRRLFPGKWYALKQQSGPEDRLINWDCPGCRTKVYVDANGMENPPGIEDPPVFPFAGGVATRLINVHSYSDSSGNKYKLMSFNHSAYDPDGIQMVRFSGGLLGMARFVLTDSGWRLQTFQPAIGAYGSFSQAPTPRPLLIGDSQYAYMVVHVNGPPGGPFHWDYYLVADIGGRYKQILAADNCERTSSDDGQSNWTCTYRSPASEKRSFRDIVIVCKGQYFAVDQASANENSLPVELKGKLKANERGNFTITHVYTYSEGKGYRERLPARVSIKRRRASLTTH